MRGVLKAAVAFACLAPSQAALAQASSRIAFIGCPVMRDMDLPERPCWFVENGDKLYFVGMQGDIFPPVIFFPPQLKHRALVEAEVVDGPEVCGGRPLKNVKVSVLPEIDLACDTILPKAGYAPGPIGRPSPPYRPGRGLASDPSTWPKPRPEPAPPQPPFTAKTFTVPFKFASDFITLEEAGMMNGAIRYFEGTKARKLIVDVHRDRVELSNGEVIEEGEDIARYRAELMRRNFTEWGVPESKLEIRTDRLPEPGGRFVKLTVEP